MWTLPPPVEGQLNRKLRIATLTVTDSDGETRGSGTGGAGAETSRYYGESEELLGKYGVYVGNSGGRSWPVGSLKPNGE